MDLARFSWQVLGLAMVGFGVFVLAHRGYRSKIARSMSAWHAPLMRRVGWIYGPKALREWWFSEAGWQRQVFVWAIVLILMGFLVMVTAAAE